MASKEQRIVVVTGASRGLGLEWITQLLRDPVNSIIAVVRNPATAQDLKQLEGPKVQIVKGDLDDLESFSGVAEQISKLGGGKIDWLINNAGIMVGAGQSPTQGISTSTVKEWEDQFKINVTAQVFFTIALLPLLEAGKEKKVINLTSMLGDLTYTKDHPELQFSSYSVTKAGITMANAKFHNEFKDKGFTFLALNPGWVNTDLGGKGMGQYAPLQPEESISRCLSFINRSVAADSGKFWSLDGLTEAVVA